MKKKMSMFKQLTKTATLIGMLFSSSAQATLEVKPNAAKAHKTIMHQLCPADGNLGELYPASQKENIDRMLTCARFWYGAFLCVPNAYNLNAIRRQGIKWDIKILPHYIDPGRFPLAETKAIGQPARFIFHLRTVLESAPAKQDWNGRRYSWIEMAGRALDRREETGQWGAAIMKTMIDSKAFDEICPYNKKGLPPDPLLPEAWKTRKTVPQPAAAR